MSGGTVLRNDGNHAFWVSAAQPVRRSMAGAGFIRGLFDELSSFEIERSISHVILVTAPLDFCPEPG